MTTGVFQVYSLCIQRHQFELYLNETFLVEMFKLGFFFISTLG